MTTLVIGTDEAGYGPKLGPLVVTATAWLVEDDFFAADWTQTDWFSPLAPFLANKAPASDDKLWIGDSKEIYKGKNLAALERVVLGGLACISESPPTWTALLERLVKMNQSSPNEQLPWYAGKDLTLPLVISAEDIEAMTRCWQRLAEGSPLKLIDAKSAVIEPPQFNAAVARCGNKATLLSETTLELVDALVKTQITAGTTLSRILITCDRHGGRKSYAGVLQHAFAGVLPSILREQPTCSLYSFPLAGVRAEAAFTVKGESQLPIATASLFSKYMRKVAMHLFNVYWQEQLPGLLPTAGYTVDADRFCADIAELKARQELTDERWIRCR